MKKQEKLNSKGITLVALVVTIIILIILAGVSINAVMGENGIITLAKRAKENIELAQIEEQESLNQLYDDFELQESQIEGTDSYAAVLKLNEFKKQIADYIDEAAKGSIDLTNEYTKPDYNTASVQTFGNAIKQIVAKVTKLDDDVAATADDILEGKEAWINGTKIIGIANFSTDNSKTGVIASVSNGSTQEVTLGYKPKIVIIGGMNSSGTDYQSLTYSAFYAEKFSSTKYMNLNKLQNIGTTGSNSQAITILQITDTGFKFKAATGWGSASYYYYWIAI